MKAFELLSSAARWCRGEEQSCVRLMARRADGRQVEPSDVRAVAWTINGAICRCYDGVHYLLALRKLWPVIGTREVAKWNNDPRRSFQEIQEALKLADL